MSPGFAQGLSVQNRVRFISSLAVTLVSALAEYPVNGGMSAKPARLACRVVRLMQEI
jgi:hypothetical protein